MPFDNFGGVLVIKYTKNINIQTLELKGSSGESTINYTSRFNVIAYIDSKHYIKSLTRPN